MCYVENDSAWSSRQAFKRVHDAWRTIWFNHHSSLEPDCFGSTLEYPRPEWGMAVVQIVIAVAAMVVVWQGQEDACSVHHMVLHCQASVRVFYSSNSTLHGTSFGCEDEVASFSKAAATSC